MPDKQTIIIETNRLILRELTLDDLDALFVLYRDPDIRKYFPDGTRTYEETKEELEWTIDVIMANTALACGQLSIKKRARLLGAAVLSPGLLMTSRR